MSTNPIKYSDLIQPDDSINRAIKELESLNATYSETLKLVSSQALELKASVEKVNSTTKEGRKAIDDSAVAAQRLAAAQRDLNIAMSETGADIVELKYLTAQQNKLNKEQAAYVNAQVNSYNALKATLATLVSQYKAINQSTADGKKQASDLAASIRQLKSEIKQYDNMLKASTSTAEKQNKISQQQTQTMQAQANSYNALNTQLKGLIAEYKNLNTSTEEGKKRATELLAQMSGLSQVIKEQDAALKSALSNSTKQMSALSEEEKARQRLNIAMSDQSVELAAINRKIQEANQIAKLQAIIATEAEGSYNRLSAQYSLNKIELNKMSQAERENTEAGKALVQQTNEIYQQMIKLQESTGNYRLSVGNYKKSWDGLGVAMNQVIRELPAAAISINTFFLGISNNIPILVDEIKRLREQNRLLAAEGKQQISVTKSIISSIFSFNTLLIAGLTALAMHGDKIFAWVKRLITGKVEVKSLNEAIDEMHKTMEEGTNDYGRNLAKFKQLQNEWKDTKGLQDQEKWIKKNESAFREFDIQCTNVAEADNIFVKNTDAVINALKNRAKATAATQLAEKKYSEALVLRSKADLEKNKETTFLQSAGSYAKAIAGGIVGPDSDLSLETRLSKQIKADRDARVESLYEEANAAEADADTYFNLAEGYREAAKAGLEFAGISPYEKQEKQKKGKQPKDMSDYIDKQSVTLRKKYEESVTALEKDEFAKRRKEAFDTYNAETDALLLKYDKNKKILENEGGLYKTLTDEQKAVVEASQKDILNTIENYQLKLSEDLKTIEQDRQIAELEIVKETLELRLQAVREGSEEELKLRLKLINTEKQIALAQNLKKPAGQRQSSADIEAGFGVASNTTIADTAMLNFDQMQALQEAEFNIVKQTESWKTIFKLQQERDRWAKILSLNNAGLTQLSDTERKTIEALIQGLNRQINEAFEDMSLLERLGLDENQIQALQDATSIFIDNLKQIFDAEVELARKEKELAEERTSWYEDMLNDEIEARNNGYAHSVATARKELDQARKEQAEKEKILAAAERRQQALDTITQTSSLITASANIWKAFSAIPFVGPALAAAAIAAMFTSFAAAKIKARQATNATQEYGEGGFEVVEGGSHASGNDVPLNVNNSKGKRMVVEGKEGLAVINKRNTRKYRKVLPDIINSLNKGTFEDKFGNAFSNKLDPVIISPVEQKASDLSRLESGLDRLIQQGEDRIYVDGKGRTIIKRKNLTQTINY